MYKEFGVGNQKIVYMNNNHCEDVNNLFERAYKLFLMKHEMRYPNLDMLYRKYKYVLTNDKYICNDAKFCVNFDQKDFGIYVDSNTYHKKITEIMHHLSGLDVICCDAYSGVCVGIGNNTSEAYVTLKDMMLYLPGMI